VADRDPLRLGDEDLVGVTESVVDGDGRAELDEEKLLERVCDGDADTDAVRVIVFDVVGDTVGVSLIVADQDADWVGLAEKDPDLVSEEVGE